MPGWTNAVQPLPLLAFFSQAGCGWARLTALNSRATAGQARRSEDQQGVTDGGLGPWALAEAARGLCDRTNLAREPADVLLALVRQQDHQMEMRRCSQS